MINLLPYSQKQELKQERLNRLVVILGSAFLIFLSSLFLVLCAIKIYLNSSLIVEKSILSSVEGKFNNLETKDFSSKLSSANAYFAKLDFFYNGPYLSDFLPKI